MTAPTNSEMAEKFTALKNQAAIDEDVMSSLAIDLSTTPVIWKEGTRYSLYLPKPRPKISEAEKLDFTDAELEGIPPASSSAVPPKPRNWFSWT